MRAAGVRSDDDIEAHYSGGMDSECVFYRALHWLAERRAGSSILNPQYGSCCLQGKVQIDFVAHLPEELYGLYTGDRAQAKEFRFHLRRYNKAFAFTSMGGSGRLDGTMDHFHWKKTVPRCTASLRYEAKGPNEELSVGLYDIHVKAVTFEPNTHERGPVRNDQEFDFMGDFLELRPASNERNHTLCICDHPARLFASGRVTGLDRDINTFTLAIWQTVNQHSRVGHITVRSMLGINALTNNRNSRLPPVDSVDSLTGDITDFGDGIAVVALDDVTYVPSPRHLCVRQRPRTLPPSVPTNFDEIEWYSDQ
ncbi:hypothetical protein EDB83DRAFT_2520255 [Lactarius deliciosus]|nr:hypothetical protein EDB83DRAFT_2520255 [Lactarius deliciosus]